MPLDRSGSKKARKKNIDVLIHREGKTPKSAVGESYGIEREDKKKKKKSKKIIFRWFFENKKDKIYKLYILN